MTVASSSHSSRVSDALRSLIRIKQQLSDRAACTNTIQGVTANGGGHVNWNGTSEVEIGAINPLISTDSGSSANLITVGVRVTKLLLRPAPGGVPGEIYTDTTLGANYQSIPVELVVSMVGPDKALPNQVLPLVLARNVATQELSACPPHYQRSPNLQCASVAACGAPPFPSFPVCEQRFYMAGFQDGEPICRCTWSCHY